MILKEAYRYQNYLTGLISESITLLRNNGWVTTTEQFHNRKKVNPDADDEMIIAEKPYTFDYTPKQLIDFVVSAIKEKEKLSSAIEDTKKKASVDIDSSLAVNKVKQDFMMCLKALARIKPCERKSIGTSYKFNADGNQVTYQYEVNSVTKIDFDRNSVQGLIKKYQKETDDISTEIDRIEVNAEVDYEPKWDINTLLEDAVLS